MSPPKGSTSRANKSASTLTNLYLVLYNAASLTGWSYVFWLTMSELIKTNGDFTKVYNAVGSTLSLVQTAAALEVIHVLLGFVKSPLATTTIQIISRLGLVWGVVYLFPEVRTHWAFTSMITAWSITEMIRYSYYGLNILGLQPRLLVWARYTFFYVLYPIGAGSECIVAYQSLPYAQEFNNTYYLFEIFALLTYIPGFPILYFHMITQRKKYLGTGKAKGKKRE